MKKIVILFIIVVIVFFIPIILYKLVFHKEGKTITNSNSPTMVVPNCAHCEVYPPIREVPTIRSLDGIQSLSLDEFTQFRDLPYSSIEEYLREDVQNNFASSFSDHCGFQQHERYVDHHTVCLEDIPFSDRFDRFTSWKDLEVEYMVFDTDYNNSLFNSQESRDQFYTHIPDPDKVYYTYDDFFGYQYYFVYQDTVLFFHGGYTGTSEKKLGYLFAIAKSNTDFLNLSEEQLASFASVLQTLYFTRLSPE